MMHFSSADAADYEDDSRIGEDERAGFFVRIRHVRLN